MASSELSVMLTAKGNLETELRGARDRVKDLSAEIRKIQSTGGNVGDELADEFRQATIAADKLSTKLNEVNRNVKKAATESTSAAAKIGNAWKKTASVFNNDLAAGLSAGALVLFGKNAVNTFAQVQDASSALSATFGANGDALIKWAKASGDALNLSQQEALSAAQTFAGFASSAGLSGQALEEFSTSLTARAADLASYYGGTTADAITAIGAALRGESEPARRYQIFVDDMALKNEYFALTGEKVTGALTMQQKILAANNVIMKQSARAQGDIERTADSMANQIKDSQQQMADFQATAGETIAIGLNPLMKMLNGAARAFSSMPQPMQQTAIAIGMIGTAALIATPRLIAMQSAIAARGGIMALAAGGKKAALGIAAITAAVVGLQAAKGDSPYLFDLNNEVDTEAALKNIIQPGFVKTVGNALAAPWDWLTLSKSPVTTYREHISAVDAQLTALVANGKGEEAAKQFEEMVKYAGTFGASVDEVKQLLPGYSSSMDAAASSTGDLASMLTDASKEADETAKKLLPLTRAMNRFGHALDVRNALVGWRKSLKDFVKKPSEETAVAAAQAFQSTVATYKEGGRAQAQFVLDNYAEMKRTIDNSGLSDAMKAGLLAPLNEAKTEADKVLAALDAISGKTVTSTIILNKLNTPGMDPRITRANGGPVWGPGTATSDSIPAMLSNGEYVLRASAVRAIGLGTLNKLNYADKMTDPSLLDRTAIGTVPTSVQSGPIIGSIVVNNPSRDVDVEKAVLRGMARAERIKKERG